MSWLQLYQIIEWVIRLVMIPVILRRRFSPSTAMAWLSVFFLLPVPVLLVYFLIGSDRLARKRIGLYRAAAAQVLQQMDPAARVSSQETRPKVDPALAPMIQHAERISGMPILGGNQVDLLGDTTDTIDHLIGDIDAAKHHAHLLYYIFRPDDTGRRVADALIRAAKRGVHCRVLADAAGSRHLFARNGLAQKLNQNDVATHRMLPATFLRRKLERLDLRNHRKLTVIDGHTAYAGSQNIVDDSYGHHRAGRWIDLTGRFTGPLVTQLQTVFIEDWAFDTGQTLDTPDIFPPLKATGKIAAQAVPTGPTQQSTSLLRVILSAINAAQQKIIITSPYLIPDEPTALALAMAAERGVQVILVIPRRSDHPVVSAAGRAYFDPLLDAGVQIYRHHPGMLHAKTMTVDDAFALLGTSNLDIRSFYLNFELNVLLYGAEITHELRFAQTRYLSDSSPVNPDQWRNRPRMARYLENAAALLSPLL